MNLQKSVLFFMTVLLISFLLCVPFAFGWTMFSELFSGIAQGFFVAVIAKKITEWIIGDSANGNKLDK